MAELLTEFFSWAQNPIEYVFCFMIMVVVIDAFISFVCSLFKTFR